MQTRLGGERIGSETMTVQNVTAGREARTQLIAEGEREREKKKPTEEQMEIQK